ncbi:MAG: glycosyltransferase family 4 protein [Gammaproteobacteria bacterium]|nr:glycosyltransferase family 4 protein [Gammaproteobacteria bacterium]
MNAEGGRRAGRPRSRVLAVIGDANDPGAWSGIPYHFLNAAKARGLIQRGVDLQPRGTEWRVRRLLWNAARALTGERPGGYQFSRGFLERLWAPHLSEIQGCEVVNHFQLSAPSVVSLAERSQLTLVPYIDMTLSELFEDYALGAKIGRRVASAALELEASGYRAARRIVAMSRRSADILQRKYAIPKERVRVVVPGANLDEAILARYGERPVSRSSEFIVGYIGKDSIRKGLYRLARAVALLRSEGTRVRLRVIGHCPDDLREADGVEATGFLDKRGDPEGFISALAQCSLGCLPSYAEALGIALLEFLRLGIPVVGTRVGGIPDAVPDGAGVLVDADIEPRGLADVIGKLCADEDAYAALCQGAAAARSWATWERAVSDFARAISAGARERTIT